MHGGVDIGVPIGTKFALKDDAVIKFAGWQNPGDPLEGYGLLVDAWFLVSRRCSMVTSVVLR